MPEQAANDRTFSSVYRHSVDEKRRVPIPFRWRPEESIEFTIIVWAQHKAGKCLRVMAPAQWAKLRADIEAMSSPEQRQLIKRSIGSLSIQAKLDASGRISIPENMAAAADITNQAVLVGLLDQFEIWSPDRYATVEAMDAAEAPRVWQLSG